MLIPTTLLARGQPSQQLLSKTQRSRPPRSDVGEVRKVLSLVNAASASSIQENFSDAFRSLKKGRPFSPSLEIKRLRAAIQPVSF